MLLRNFMVLDADHRPQARLVKGIRRQLPPAKKRIAPANDHQETGTQLTILTHSDSGISTRHNLTTHLVAVATQR